jgi:hypothetical protein
MSLIKFSTLPSAPDPIPDDIYMHIIYADPEYSLANNTNKIASWTTVVHTISSALGIQDIKDRITTVENCS